LGKHNNKVRMMALSVLRKLQSPAYPYVPFALSIDLVSEKPYCKRKSEKKQFIRLHQPHCPRKRSKWSSKTIASMASAMGVALNPTQGS
jgi:hypothetical protein